MTQFAKFISFVCHPIFIPLVSFLCYIQIVHYEVKAILELTTGQFWMMIIPLIVIFTVLLPLLGMNSMVSFGIIPDFKLENHKHRPPVILWSAAMMGGLIYAFKHLEAQANFSMFGEFYGVMFGGIAVAFITAGISYFWQISMHLTCVSGLAGAMVALSIVLFPIGNMASIIFMNSILLLAVGLTGFSRLYLKKHNLMQVLAGIVVGFGVEFTVLVKGWYF